MVIRRGDAGVPSSSPSARRIKEALVSVKKNFYSDNVSGAAPEILDALVAANAGDTAPYGADPSTERLQTRFAELFETEVEVFPVGTGRPPTGSARRSSPRPTGPSTSLTRPISTGASVAGPSSGQGETPARSPCRA